MSFAVERVPHTGIGMVWEFVEPFIVNALEYGEGELFPKDVKYKAEVGDFQLWIVTNKQGSFIGCFVTEILDYSLIASLRIVLLGGTDFPLWIELAHKKLEEYGKEHKCGRIELCGRRGWVRKLKPLGFKETYVVVTRRIDE